MQTIFIISSNKNNGHTINSGFLIDCDGSLKMYETPFTI